MAPPAPVSALRRYRVERVGRPGDEHLLDETSSHHCLVVCQTPRGTTIAIYDDRLEAEAEVAGVRGGAAVVRQRTEPRTVQVSVRRVLVAGLARKPAVERVLRMGTELGVTEFRLFVARRSVAKGLHEDRWTRIVASATQQCGRTEAPSVVGYTGLGPALEGLPPLPRWVLSPGADDWRPTDAEAVLLTGPEGGLTAEELELAAAAGFTPAGLGPWILRADTAVVAALSRLPTPSR